MKKLTEFGRRYRKKFWFALLVNAGFLLFLLLVTRPAFETNDDIALATMFNGQEARLILIRMWQGICMDYSWYFCTGSLLLSPGTASLHMP